MRALALLLAAAGLALAAAHVAPAGTEPAFAPPVTMPGSDKGNEPSIAISTSGVRYVSWQSPGTFASSPDGQTFTALGKPDSGSLGDVTNAVDAAGAIYNGQICGPPAALHSCIYKSTDGGHTWHATLAADNHPGASDRPWIDVYPKRSAGAWNSDNTRVYLEYHTFSPDDLVYVTVSTDGGHTFSAPHPVTADTNSAQSSWCNTIPGGVAVDRNGVVYALWLSGNDAAANANGCNYSQLGPFDKAWVSTSTDGGTTWTSHLAWQGVYDPVTHVGDNADKIFAALTVDAAGQVHVLLPVRHGDDPVRFVAQCEVGQTLPDLPSIPLPPLPALPTVPLPQPPALPPVPALGVRTTAGTAADPACSESPQRTDLYLVTSPDRGATWTAPLTVNQFAGSYFFPWAAAGSEGALDVAYYRSDSLRPNDPASRWGIGFSQITGAKAVVDPSGTRYASAPSVTEQLLDPNPVHVGGLCSFGIFCTAVPMSNRNLADSLGIALDPAGGANVVWTNDAKKKDANGKAVSEVDFACQNAGSSATGGTLNRCYPAGGGGSAGGGSSANGGGATGQGGVAGASSGSKRFVRGSGKIGTATFLLDLSKGPGHKVVYTDARHRLRFRSLRVTSVTFSAHAARVSGIGLLGGARVQFAAVAVDHGTSHDVFRIAWRRGAAHGGIVSRGYVLIR